MRIRLFYPSLLSDLNNDTAHSLRGLAMELLLRGHEVCVYEPRYGSSLQRLLARHGHAPIARFHAAFPGLASRRYDPRCLDAERVAAEADVLVVHDSCDAGLIQRLAACAAASGTQLWLHAASPRLFSSACRAAARDLSRLDGILAENGTVYGECAAQAGTTRVVLWPGAADTRVFRRVTAAPEVDVVWVCDWESAPGPEQLDEFLLEPVRRLGLRARVFGAGFPPAWLEQLAAAGIEHGGWVPNFELPAVLAQGRIVLHLPPRDSARRLPACPGNRPFEALACARPLVCSAWEAAGGLFEPGVDLALARDGAGVHTWLRTLLDNPDLAAWMGRQGQHTVLAQHTCGHRATELLRLCAVQAGRQPQPALPAAYPRLPFAI